MLKDILKKVRYLEISANNKIDSLFAGNYRSAFKGRGIEFADIRPYDMGDDIRDIDWKTTSKQNELFVKTYHESRDNTLFFVIDGSQSMQFSSEKNHKYELLLETFSLLSFSAVKNGDRVGILFYQNGEEKIFPPKKGRKNLLQILKYCIEKFENPSFSKSKETDMSETFKRIFSFLKHSSSIFWLVGGFPSLSNLEKKHIKIIKTKHDFVPIIFSDKLEEDFDKLGNFFFQDSFSGEIKQIEITPEIKQNFKKIRKIKKLKFLDFFKKNHLSTLAIKQKDNILKNLYLFFSLKQS